MPYKIISRPSAHRVNLNTKQNQVRHVVRNVPAPKAKIHKVQKFDVVSKKGLLLKQNNKTQENKHISILPVESKKNSNKPIIQEKTQPQIRQVREANRSSPFGAKTKKINLNKSRSPKLSSLINKQDSFNSEAILALKNKGVGKILVMIACGPSVREASDLERLKGHPRVFTMAINKPQPPLWPTDAWAFCDHTQYNRNKNEFDNYKGMLINSSSIKVRKSNQTLIRAKQGRGFSFDLTNGFYIGRSTTYTNMQTALYMGFEKIFLFGVDMCEVDGKLWSYGVNPDVSAKNRIQRFNLEAEHYQYAANALQEHIRKKFYFCTTYNPFPFIREFNRRDQKTVVSEILQYADELKLH